MIAAIVAVCLAMFALFLVAAVAGNRAQTRMAAERAEADRRLRDTVNGDPAP